MRVLVLGGSGFIGSAVVRDLVQRGHDVTSTYIGEQSDLETKNNERHVSLEIPKHADLLAQLASDNDVIVYLLTPGLEQIQCFMRVLSDVGSCKVVYASSLVVYPESRVLQSEEILPQPVTEYAKSKVYEEHMLSRVTSQHDIQLCIARLANVYGNRMDKGFIHWVMNSVVANTELTVNGDGSQIRDFINIDDVARGICFLVEQEQVVKNDVYNVSSGVGSTLNQVLSLVEQIAGRPIKKRYAPLPKENSFFIGNNEKILQKSGYTLRMKDLEQGLRDTLKAYDE